MKREIQMNSVHSNCLRKIIYKNRPYFKIIFYTIISLPIFAILVMAGSCKQKDKVEQNNDGKFAVTWEDIENFCYPDPESQKKELDKYKNIIESKTAIDKPDKVIRQMMEDVSLYYIQEYLKQLSETVTPEKIPNVSVFGGIINEISNMEEPDVDEFIKKAVEKSNNDKLCIALFGLKNELQQAKVAEALFILQKPESVRLLTKRLLYARLMLKMSSGEGSFVTENLCKSIVKAIESCSGLDFSDYDPSSEEATYAVIKRCMDWLEKSKEMKVSGAIFMSDINTVFNSGRP